MSNLDECKAILRDKLDEVIDSIKSETKNISKFLDLINNVSQLQMTIQKQIDKEISMTMPKELREVRSGSIKFSTKILALAMKSQNLEELILKFAGDFEHPNNKNIDEKFKNIEHSPAAKYLLNDYKLKKHRGDLKNNNFDDSMEVSWEGEMWR